VTATASLIAAFFLRPKDKGDGDKTNTITTGDNDKSPVIQNPKAPVNINYGDKPTVATTTGNYSPIIQNPQAPVYIIDNRRFDFEEFIEKQTAKERERIKELETRLKETEDSHSKERWEWGEEKAALEKKVEDTESNIRKISAYYESVDIASSPLYKEAFDLFTQGKLDEALVLLDNAALEKIDKANADTRILKAQLLELKYDFENAAANYLKAAAIFPSFDNNLLVANFYYNLKQFNEAETYYTQCLTLAKKPEEKAAVLNNLGALQSNRNEYKQAEASFQEALKIQRDLAAVNPQTYLPDVAMTLNNLGNLQRVRNENAQAEASYQEALKISRDLAAVNPQTYLPDMAMTLNNLGILQSDRNENAQAEASYQESLEIYRALAAVNPQTYLPDVADTLNNLGVLQRDRNEYAQAAASYQEALTIRRDLATVNPQTYLPYVADTLNNLGNLQRNINENAQAEASYQEALKIYRALAAVNPQTYLPDVAMTLANLAIFYQNYVPNKDLSVKYAKEVLSYRAALEHIPAARQAIELAEAVLMFWELAALLGLE
jgi:tetratricopeptide (TPR) repeat protein